jgi:sterol desaturase/sphingolipid hydroxylase (fatty acid hydroxylase superfamily)
MILGGALMLALALSGWVAMPAAVLTAQAAAVVAIALCERVFPYLPQWNRSHGDLRTDVVHAIVSALGTAELVRPLILVAGAVAAGALSQAFGMSLWPSDWPLLVQLGLALVVAELPQYWLHRWQHEHDRLWRFHATHHSAPRLYWLNAARFHPLDLGLLYLVGYVPLVVMGCPPDVILLFALFDAVFGMLQHSNIDVRLGPLNHVFSMAEPHRWHHSRVLEEANSNYGSNLIVWDVVFGTFFLPSGRHPPVSIGIGDMPAFPTGYLAQLASPFRWGRVKREAARAPA